MFNLAAIQSALRDFHLDAWLLYDFRGSNLLARRVLDFPMARLVRGGGSTAFRRMGSRGSWFIGLKAGRSTIYRARKRSISAGKSWRKESKNFWVAPRTWRWNTLLATAIPTSVASMPG